MTYGFHQPIDWKNLAEIGQVNGAFALTINGVFVLNGEEVTPLMLR